MRPHQPRHVFRQPTVLATAQPATVKWFDPVRGFGFVQFPDGRADALLPGVVVQAAGLAGIPDGSAVVVDLIDSRKGAQVSVLHSVDTSTAQARAPRPERPERFDRPARPDRFERSERRPDRGGDRGPAPRRGGGFAGSGETREVDGTVKWFDTAKGFGFVAPDGGGPDVFVHVRALDGSGLTALADNQRVRLAVRQGDKGPQAVSVKTV